jgi:hypothetical protein
MMNQPKLRKTGSPNTHDGQADAIARRPVPWTFAPSADEDVTWLSSEVEPWRP